MPIVTKVPIIFCEDCKWFRRDRLGDEFSKCRHPKCDFDSSNVVTRKMAGGMSCKMSRSSPNACGKDARYFEEREIVRIPMPDTPWWRRLFS